MKKIPFLIVIFVLIDQIIKFIVNMHIDLGQSVEVIKNFFNLTYVQNTGAAFSMLEGFGYIFIILGLIVIYIIYKFFIKNKDLKKHEIIIYSLLISGVLGNLIDRLIHGYVIDYLDFNIFGYNFAIFNLADTFIVISIIILLIKSFKEDLCKK